MTTTTSVYCGGIYLLLSLGFLLLSVLPWASSPSPVVSQTPTHSPTGNPAQSLLTGVPTGMPTPRTLTTNPSTYSPSSTPIHSSPSLNPSHSPSYPPSFAPTFSSPSARPSFLPTGSPTQSPAQSNASDNLRLLQESPSPASHSMLWLLCLWPTLCCALLGIAYLRDDPADETAYRSLGAAILGKELDGSMKSYCVLFMLPILVPLWCWCFSQHIIRTRSENDYDEIVPGIFLGRFPFNLSCLKMAESFPESATTVVDLAAEMPIPRRVFKARRYLGIPTVGESC